MANAAKGLDDAVILALEDALGHLDLHDFLMHAKIYLEVLVNAPRRRQRRTILKPFLIVIPLHDLVHEVANPGSDRLDDNLCAFLLQEPEHVEVAVAFGGLRPELAGDLYDGLYACA